MPNPEATLRELVAWLKAEATGHDEDVARITKDRAPDAVVARHIASAKRLREAAAALEAGETRALAFDVVQSERDALYARARDAEAKLAEAEKEITDLEDKLLESEGTWPKWAEQLLAFMRDERADYQYDDEINLADDIIDHVKTVEQLANESHAQAKAAESKLEEVDKLFTIGVGSLIERIKAAQYRAAVGRESADAWNRIESMFPPTEKQHLENTPLDERMAARLAELTAAESALQALREACAPVIDFMQWKMDVSAGRTGDAPLAQVRYHKTMGELESELATLRALAKEAGDARETHSAPVPEHSSPPKV